jgi:uracil-DNA glycosylase
MTTISKIENDPVRGQPMLGAALLRTEPDRNCPLCPRLAGFREAARAREPEWFNSPVPSFGDPGGRLLIVGLAPGLQGANRTGQFLSATVQTMPKLRAIVALGRVAHESTLKALGLRSSAAPFAHGAIHQASTVKLYDSYHCSRYNTNTRVLTPEMFRSVFAKVRADLA